VEHHGGLVGERRDLGPGGGQQRVAVEPPTGEQPGRIGERACAEADQPLAVEPGEVVLV
jgi:hypothetical protein